MKSGSSYYPGDPLSEATILTPALLQEWIDTNRPFKVIDVRPEDQRRQHPLRRIRVDAETDSDFPVENRDPLVLICQYGIITEGIIVERGLKNAFSLLGGAQAWEEYQAERLDLSSWSRQIALPELGVIGQKKLREATVAIVGIGGLGCAAATVLAGSGIGRLILVDGDHVAQSNLHRQPLFGLSDLGKPKVVVAAERLQGMHPELTIAMVQEYLRAENGDEILSEAHIILDASDNLETRRLLNEISKRLKIPLIYGGLYRFEGQVAVLNHNGSSGYDDLFPGNIEKGDPCSTAGTLGMLPAIIGNIQALEAVKLITGIQPNLSGKLLLYNGLTHQTETIRL